MVSKMRFWVLMLVVTAVGGVVIGQQTGSAPSSGGNSASTGSSSGSGKDMTIEQLYLSQDVELQILRTQALSDNRETKFLALQTIRSMVQDGTIAKGNPGIEVVLDSLATEGLSSQVRQGGKVVNNYPDVRREACNILGSIGGERAQSALLTVLTEDDEPMVLAEAVYALGRIGQNSNHLVSQDIVHVLNTESAKRTPDNNLAFACLLAIQKLSEKNGGISDPEVINAMLNVASGNYIRDVRLKAIDVVYQLRKQQSQQG